MSLIFDTVYGNIHFNKKDLPFLDSKWMKRTKRIKQLGLLDNVFPSASHSRFEHSLGVYYLADKYIKLLESNLNISTNQINSKKILFTEKEKTCIRLAGLFHDLGHGPFSHVFDRVLNKINNNNIISDHETRSQHIVEKIFKEVQPNNINGYDIDLIKNIINPNVSIVDVGEHKKYNCEKPYLFEIINNKINNIDVDKLDYLQRDSKHIGIDGFDPGRILNKSYICPERKSIVYDISLKNNIFDLFYKRYQLHKDIYNHKTVKMCEIMLSDSLILGNSFLNIEKYCCIENGELSDKFLELDDSIYNKLLYCTDPLYESSKQLINRIEKRILYKSIVVDNPLSINLDNYTIKTDTGTYTLSSIKDIKQINMSFSLCNGENDPLDNVLFYNKYLNTVEYIKMNNRLIPTKFQENIVMLYKDFYNS